MNKIDTIDPIQAKTSPILMYYIVFTIFNESSEIKDEKNSLSENGIV